MKTQYYDVLSTHPNLLAAAKVFAENKDRHWRSDTFAKAFVDTFGVPRDDMGTLDASFGLQYWLRLLENRQYRWLAWECGSDVFGCWPLGDEDEDGYLLVNFTNASYHFLAQPEKNYRQFCSDATLSVIKGQPVIATTPTRIAAAAAGGSSCNAETPREQQQAPSKPAAPKKSRKRPAKEKEEETQEPPEAKKALFVEP
jgi:hypothetical protein